MSSLFLTDEPIKKLHEEHNSTEFLKRKEYNTWSEELVKKHVFLESLNPVENKEKSIIIIIKII